MERLGAGARARRRKTWWATGPAVVLVVSGLVVPGLVAVAVWGASTAVAQNSTLPGLAVGVAPAQGAPGDEITVSGTGYGACPDYGTRRADVLWDGYGTGVSVPIGADGTFTATLPIPADAPNGEHLVYGRCVDGGEWARTAVDVAPRGGRLAVSLSSISGTPGSDVTVRGTGYETCPDYGTRRADVLWDGYGTGVSVPIEADGTFTATLPIPADAPNGEHLVYGRCVDGGEWATSEFAVVPAAISTTEATTPPTSEPTSGSANSPTTGLTGALPPGPGAPPSPDPGRTSSAAAPPIATDSGEPPADQAAPPATGREERTTEPWRRPAFLDAIPTPAELWDFLNDGRALGLLAVPLLAWFLIGWPAELFNTTYRENERTIRRWVRLPPEPRPARATSWPVVVAFAGLAAVLMTAVQVNVTSVGQSVPVALGYFIAIPLVVLAYEFTIEQRLRTVPGGGTARLRVIGAALVIAVACAAVSRLLAFQPGYVYGLLLGYAVVGARDTWHVRVRAEAVLRGVVVLVALAACAWLFWQFGTRASAERPGAPAPLVALDTLLSQIVVLSLETLVIGLVPVHFLHGSILRRWNRRVWLAVYAGVLVLFCAVLVRWRPGVTWEDAVRAFWLFAAFCAGSVLFWGFFAVRARLVPAVTASPQTEQLTRR